MLPSASQALGATAKLAVSQPPFLNVWPSALVPGSSLKSTGTVRRSLLSLVHIGAPLDAGGYHSNDTASSTQTRALHILKTLLPASAGRGRLAAELDCAVPNLLWNPPSNYLPSTPSRRTPSRRTPSRRPPSPRATFAHTSGAKESIATAPPRASPAP